MSSDALDVAIEAGGDEARPEAKLLLWFARAVLQVDELDAYQYILDAPGHGIDGLIVERQPESARPVVHVLQAKVGVAPTSTAIRNWAAEIRDWAARNFTSESNAELKGLAGSLGLVGGAAGDFDVRPTLVTDEPLSVAAKRAAREASVVVYDFPWLVNLAAALNGPGLLDVAVHIEVDESKRFWTESKEGPMLVCEITANQIASWPGIEDRRLFGLNVRGELRESRVRSSLDGALEDSSDAANFVAYHNGLTVLCRSITSDADGVEINGISVVNGAQSVLAFDRNAAHLDKQSPSVLVKLVSYEADDPVFATEVARRSNTQTAVNPRNLRANDPLQVALARDIARSFPGLIYITKPDATVQPPPEAIANDDVAQWLCAIFIAQPWLAVKRTELFREPTYSKLFGAATAAHVVLASRIYEAVQSQKDAFPSAYRRAWRLTSVMALYLMGEALRTDPATSPWLKDPKLAFEEGAFEDTLTDAASTVADVLTQYNLERVEQFGHDDFKVDFKRENAAVGLGRRAARAAAKQR